MKTIKPNAIPAEAARQMQEIGEDAAALAAVPDAAWGVLMKRFANAIHELDEVAVEPNRTAEERHYLSGAVFNIRELHKQLSDLKTGAWRDWPGMHAPRKEKQEDDDE